MGAAVILLNADFSPLNVVQIKRAIKLLVKQKAVVVQATTKVIENAEKTFSLVVPKVIRLVEYVKFIRRYKVTFSFRNVFMRDGFKCAYCGCDHTKLTIDHVLPSSRGGKTDFDNCVAACSDCNAAKADRTPHEAKMELRVKPHKPSVMELLAARMKHAGVYEQIDFAEMVI